MTPRDFADGLELLGNAHRATLGPGHFEAYGLAILPHVSDAKEWRAFVVWALGRGRWRYFPTAMEVVDALSEFRGQGDPTADAVAMYERVMGSGRYSPETGVVWDVGQIRSELGLIAAEAFVAAGGHMAFASTYRSDDRRRRFIEVYAQRVREGRHAAALPAGQAAKQLSGGRDGE